MLTPKVIEISRGSAHCRTNGPAKPGAPRRPEDANESPAREVFVAAADELLFSRRRSVCTARARR
jgi:hypothetical protein